MKAIDLNTARLYAKSSCDTFISSFESTKVFGEKGGHTAFCCIHFMHKDGGGWKSFNISKANFIILKNEGFNVCVNEQNL